MQDHKPDDEIERQIRDAELPDETPEGAAELKSRVLKEIAEAGEVDLDAEVPAPDVDGKVEMTPKGPGVGMFGYNLVPFRCAKCGQLDHIDEQLAEVYQKRRIWCLPCQSPHRFKWRKDPDTGERFLYPDPSGKQPPARLGEAERRELELRHGELMDLQQRRDYLQECVATMTEELSRVLPRIVELQTTILPEAQAALEAIETDPQRDLKQNAMDLAKQIGAAMRKATAQRKKDLAEQARTPRSVAPRR